MKRKAIFGIFAVCASVVVGWAFWHQEFKYALPTPKPASFEEVALGSTIDLSLPGMAVSKVTLLHFFNPECPCSKFNMKEFESMAKRYADKVNFLVILQADDEGAIEDFNDKYALNLPVVLDKGGGISDRCGIYSTPQAVILGGNNTLYYKGNYNKTRFCSRKETSFAQIALDSLLLGRPLPLFVKNELTAPYGCTLPSDDDNSSIAKLF